MIYRILNHIAGRPDYIVTDAAEITTSTNTGTCNTITVGVESDADALLIVNRLALLERESYRFTMAREVVDGNNVTWMAADAANDPEDSTYQVFNQYTGEHEPITGITAAQARREEIKLQFAADLGLDKWVIVEQLPQIPVVQNINTNTNTVL